MTQSPLVPFDLDLWYRHVSDPDQSLRDQCQCLVSVRTLAEIPRELAELRAQGYTIQKVVLRVHCARCNGVGRFAVYPKGTRKDRRGSVPEWRLQWTECPTCQGKGDTHVEVLETA